jgi:predicted DNA-binding transcriptional regulator AlpA
MTATSSRRSTSKPRKAPPSRRAPMRPVVVPDDSDEPTQSKMIFKPKVLELVGHSFPTVWKWMRAGTFPLSFNIGSKTAWRESEINQWLANRPRSSFKRGE